MVDHSALLRVKGPALALGVVSVVRCIPLDGEDAGPGPAASLRGGLDWKCRKTIGDERGRRLHVRGLLLRVRVLLLHIRVMRLRVRVLLLCGPVLLLRVGVLLQRITSAERNPDARTTVTAGAPYVCIIS